MLNKLSKRLAGSLAARIDGDADKEAIYTYGLELIISTAAGLVSILLFSAFLDEVFSGVIFITVFVPLRLFTGGYHAETYGKCFVISNLSYLLLLFITCGLWKLIPIIVWYGILLVVCYYIAREAPVINYHQIISENKRKRSNKVARYIVGIDLVGITILAKTNQKQMCMAILSVYLVSAFMLIANKSCFFKNILKGVAK